MEMHQNILNKMNWNNINFQLHVLSGTECEVSLSQDITGFSLQMQATYYVKWKEVS